MTGIDLGSIEHAQAIKIVPKSHISKATQSNQMGKIWKMRYHSSFGRWLGAMGKSKARLCCILSSKRLRSTFTIAEWVCSDCTRNYGTISLIVAYLCKQNSFEL